MRFSQSLKYLSLILSIALFFTFCCSCSVKNEPKIPNDFLDSYINCDLDNAMTYSTDNDILSRSIKLIKSSDQHDINLVKLALGMTTYDVIDVEATPINPSEKVYSIKIKTLDFTSIITYVNSETAVGLTSKIIVLDDFLNSNSITQYMVEKTIQVKAIEIDGNWLVPLTISYNEQLLEALSVNIFIPWVLS